MLPNKILLVEKDEFYVDIIGTYVTFFLQQTLISVRTLPEAFDRVLNDQPDLVLLSLAVSSDGDAGNEALTFAERMRDDPDTKRIPIIAISNDVTLRDHALGRGCAEFLPIPFRVHQLQAQIDRLFDRV